MCQKKYTHKTKKTCCHVTSRAFAVDVVERRDDVGGVEARVLGAEATGLGAGQGIKAVVDVDPELPALFF